MKKMRKTAIECLLITLISAIWMSAGAGSPNLLAQQPLAPLPQMGPPDAAGHRPGDDADSRQKEMLARLQTKRNEERQQQIVKDTTKLLALATELKQEVDKSNKDVLSIDVIRKADEIDKLSKAIREHMRD